MKGLVLWLLALLVSGGLAARDDPAADVTVRRIPDGRVVTLRLPGVVLDTADACAGAPSPEDGPAKTCHGLLIITGSQPRALYLFDPAADTVRRLDAELPARAEALAVMDLDADGTTDLLVGEPGRLYRLGSIGRTLELEAPALVAETAHLDLEKLESGGFLAPGRLVVPELGTLRRFRIEGGAATLVAEHELPLRAEREPTGLRLYGYPVTALEIDGRTLYATGPEAHGHHRLRSVLIDPAAESDGAAEAWSRFPEPESVVSSWYASFGGRAALVVTTVRADRLGLFEKQKLRVFSLRPGDRSRSGSPPSLVAETSSVRWHETEPCFIDVDGDGDLDLVHVQPSGLGGKNLVVEAYLGRGRAQFHPVPLRSVVRSRYAESWKYGVDMDGDGAPDLVTRSSDLVQVFRGLASSKKKQVLEKKPYRVIDLTGTGAALGDDEDEDDNGEDEVDWGSWRVRHYLEVRDVDRDGDAEILVRAELDGTSLLRIVD